MRMKKGRWLHRLAVALGTAAAAVMLTQVPAAARDLICTGRYHVPGQCNRNSYKRQWTFISGPIMPGDTLKVQGRQEEFVQQAVATPEHMYDR